MEKNIRITGLGVPERLKALRLAKKLSKGDLAERSGLAFRTIHDLERGRRDRVLEKTLVLLAQALEVGYDELLHGRRDRPARRDAPVDRDTPPLTDAPAAGGTPVSQELPPKPWRRRFWLVVAGVAVVVTAAVALQPWRWQKQNTGREEVWRSVVTTSSRAALEHYRDGVEALEKIHREEAKRHFRRALELDSTFVMSYVRLTNPLILGSPPEALALIDRAERHSHGVSDVERRYLRSRRLYLERDTPGAIAVLERLVTDEPRERDAYKLIGHHRMLLRDYDGAIRAYRRALELHPGDRSMYNRLAYAYHAVGDVEQALWAVNRYVDLAPDEANPYDTRGDILSRNGRPQEAIESYRRAVELKPDFFPSIQSLGVLHVLTGDYKTAESYFRRLMLTRDAGARGRGRLFLAAIPLYQGHLTQALETLDNCIAGDALDDHDNQYLCHKYQMKADIYSTTGRHDAAISSSTRMLEAARQVHYDWMTEWFDDHVCFLARAGRMDEAASYRDSIQARISDGEAGQQQCYWLAKGCVEFYNGDFESACVSFKMAYDLIETFRHGYAWGRACLEAGRPAEAAEIFERLLSSYGSGRVTQPIEAVRAYYYAGLAREQSGDGMKAARRYQEFLQLWADADPPLHGLTADAASRVEGLATDRAGDDLTASH